MHLVVNGPFLVLVYLHTMRLFNRICHEILTATKVQDPLYEDIDPGTGSCLVRSLGKNGCIERASPIRGTRTAITKRASGHFLGNTSM